MELLSPQIAGFQKNSSMIRRMFEAAIELRKKYGVENVYDFSLGSPDQAPPELVIKALKALPEQINRPAGLGYMPNAGYPEAREALAAWLTKQQGVPLAGKDLVLTVGAAGGLNALFRAIITPGEEVICPAPYFVEYGFYCGNYGGVLKPVKSRPDTFQLDIDGIAAAINEKTRALIINSPNNPTGVVYTEDEIKRLAAILQAATDKYGRPIFLIADEPYRFLAFDGVKVPSVLPLYKYSVLVSSFSKNLGLAGERIGYVVVNPAMENSESLVGGVIFTNRTLGSVNAPCLGQKLMMASLDTVPDISVYEERRRLMAEVLDKAGIEYQLPAGTFYFFPKVPGSSTDDVAFVAKLQEHRILAVPGSGFGYPGYYRLALCTDKRFILAAAEGFAKAAAEFRS